MPVKFPEFDLSEFDQPNTNPNHDLEIIDNQAVESPFINTPSKKKVYKPLPPTQEKELEKKIISEDKENEVKAKRVRKEKQLSEKQKKHLENMRLKKAQKKMKEIKETIQSTDNNISVPTYTEPTPQELSDMEANEFDNWLKNMSKFEKIMKKMEAEKERKAEIERKREEALELKYRKKFEDEAKAKSEYEKKIRPLKSGSIAQPDVPINMNILEQKEEINPYDKYYSF